MIPAGSRVLRVNRQFGAWFDPNLVVLSTTAEEEVIVSWWANEQLFLWMAGRRYDNKDMFITEQNKFPQNAYPLVAIRKYDTPHPTSETVWAGKHFHKLLPKVRWFGQSILKQDLKQELPNLYGREGIVQRLELDNRGMTVLAPIKGKNIKADKCSIHVADIHQIKLQQKPWNSAVTITTLHGTKKCKFQFCTTTPEKWRLIALLIQHIPLLDTIRGTRSKKEWKIKRAAAEATRRVRERLRFPRIAVKREREQTPDARPGTAGLAKVV